MVEDNIKQIKMVNGDELLCEVLEELDEDLIIRYCLIIDRLNPSTIDDIKEEKKTRKEYKKAYKNVIYKNVKYLKKRKCYY